MSAARPSEGARAGTSQSEGAPPGTPALPPGGRPPLATHGRFDYSPITRRPHHGWPGECKLAVYLGFNIEHFAWGSGMGARLGASFGEPDVLNYSWREYGNRVGAWRCLDLFESLGMPAGIIANTAILDHCPELIEACVARGDELIGHGHTNAEHQGQFDEDEERVLLQHCRDRLEAAGGKPVQGWLSPWIAESPRTPDLLAETGYGYTLNWCHDDQPVRMRTRRGTLWSLPYPQEVNDIPMIIARQMDGKDFAQLIIDNFDEMLVQAQRQPLVMGIALHPYLIGQPYRLRHLRRALAHIAAHRAPGQVWITTPGEIFRHVDTLFPLPRTTHA